MDPETESLPAGSIRTRGRMAASTAHCAIINSELGNMYLVEFLRSESAEWKGELHFHQEEVDAEGEEPGDLF
ncbi:hypothetical protein CBS101457_006875 [Exobasidium rhododendri]|nr:hypothetical protein CBS101457_006875 [Exobasidium rhododendri]